MKSKGSFFSSTHAESQKPIDMGGIASGSEIIGRGRAAFEFTSTKAKQIRVARDAFHAPELHADLVPPQKLMRNDKDGWSKINGEK